MGRKSRKRRSPERTPLVEAILSGKKKVTAKVLVDLIVNINPTGKPLQARQAERQYREKTGLQNRLIEWYADELRVTPDEHDPGVVLINHRFLSQHACHARLDGLSSEAANWVTRF